MCPQFKKLPVQERVNVIKANKLCFKCFLPNCNVRKCNTRNCFCGKPHNKLIHFPREGKFSDSCKEIKDNSEVAAAADSETLNREQHGEFNSFFPPNFPSDRQQIVATSFAKNKTKNVLLSTVRVLVKDKYSQWQEVRCLLDSGSQACLITKDCANRLQLKIEKINTLLSCLNDASMTINGCVTATIANKEKNFEKSLNMFVVRKITDFVPNKVINVHIDVPNSITLADYSFNIPGKIDMLLGAEIFYELLRPGQIYSQNPQLLLQNSCFGYIATGNLDQRDEVKIHCGLIRGEDLNVTLRKFWEIEDVNIELTKSKEQAICEEHFTRTHKRNEKGKYIVTMPLRDDPSCLGQSREIALRKLRSLWKRLSRDEKYLSLYKDFLEEYKNLGHMREVTEDKTPDVAYYAPHHGVYRPDKDTTKLRVVFNCSSPTTNGTSLNSLQFNGGVIQSDLFTIMVGFRLHIYALTADIKMMYRMILIDPSQYPLQRILWSNSIEEPPKTFELTTVTYGTVSAPYLAMRTLYQLSLDEEKKFPKASPILRDNFYMDDVLFGASTLEEAKELQQELKEVIQSAGMELHKWCANNDELSPSMTESYNFYNKDEIKTLGVSWKPKDDCFVFRVKVDLKNSYTKREVLSTIARIFDPLGLIGPIIAKAKIFMQKLWRLKIDWNDALPAPEYREWHQFLITLERINDIKIERCIVIPQAVNIEIHGFADASELCYGAAIYCKSNDSRGRTLIRLISSKSRVAPVKSLTIPRLELCAAVLLAKLMNKVLAALKVMINEVYFWTDSTIVLAWLQKEPMDLKPFVQHRVATIQDLSPIQQWHHIASDQNPSDVLSRGIDPDKLFDHELWYNGPKFLTMPEYPNRDIPVSVSVNDFEKELKSTVEHLNERIFISTNSTFLSDFLDISNNYPKLVRVLSFIYRFINNCKNKDKQKGPLNNKEIETAERILIKMLQEEEFRKEIVSLKKSGTLSPRSQVSNLHPFIDKEGLLRVGGRLGNSDLNYDKKFPILLPSKHKLTELIVVFYHKKFLHAGPNSLLYYLREKFWVTNGRNLCRKVVHKCVKCFRVNPNSAQQILGNLPKDRIVQNYPFNITGVDFTGPFYIKYKYQRRGTYNKIYVAIFICFVTKAIHLELVTDLTSAAFIAALKRFISRRGKCSKLYTDNAGNFVGANAELKKLYKMVNGPDDQISGYMSSENIDWQYSPPRAPNFGGLWEAGVKSFKYYLKRAAGNLKLTYEEFLTLIIQIEGMLNSRPLVPLTANVEDLNVLTPAHFLLGRSITSITEPDLSEITENRLSQWQKITKLFQSIWRKWHLDYLCHLQQRSRWKFEKQNICVGDMVILKEDNLPPCEWPLARISKIFPGADKKVRVVEISTASGKFKRSISKVCPLPIND